MPFTRSESPRTPLLTPTLQGNRWMITPGSSRGNVSTTSYTGHRSIHYAQPELQFWNRHRVTSCLPGTSLENRIHFPIILGSTRLSPFVCLKGNRETSLNLLILKYPLQLPTQSPRDDRRVSSSIHRSRFPRYPIFRPTPLRGWATRP